MTGKAADELQREDLTMKMVRRRTMVVLVAAIAALALVGWLLAYFVLTAVAARGDEHYGRISPQPTTKNPGTLSSPGFSGY